MIIGKSYRGLPIAIWFDKPSSVQIAIKFPHSWEQLNVGGAPGLDTVDMAMAIARAFVDEEAKVRLARPAHPQTPPNVIPFTPKGGSDA